MFVCKQAVRTSIYGRPGACYVDIAGDMVNAKVDRSKVRFAVFSFLKLLFPTEHHFVLFYFF